MPVIGSILEGDNKEFAVVTAGEEVTLHFNDNSKTSANDTATDKYLDNPISPEAITIRTNKSITILSYNKITFTDPITVIINTAFTEVFNRGIRILYLNKLKLKTTVADTNIKVRIR